MEDSHAISLNLDESQEVANSNTFFAVYDGHGGTVMPSWSSLLEAERIEHRRLGRTVCRPKCASTFGTRPIIPTRELRRSYETRILRD
jgi:serine/threonine protein phosphatase PrpC